jgi:DNA-binding transcriptional LysR family regulator
LAEAEALRERARALAGGEAGVLRLGVTPQFIEAALPEVLTRYSLTYPEIEVQLVEDGGGALLRRVRQGSYILGLGCGAPAGSRASRSSRSAYWPSCSEDIGWQVKMRWR